jgi:chromosome segregation ATPase
VNGTGTHRIGPIHQRPQNVTDVLCRELGAAHPDGALRQIRTMKRVLRTHYLAQKRLERYGVDSTMDAAGHIARLREHIDAERSAREAQARANVQTLDAALQVLHRAKDRLQELARTRKPDSGEAAREAPATDTDARTTDAAEDSARITLDDLRRRFVADTGTDTAPNSSAHAQKRGGQGAAEFDTSPEAARDLDAAAGIAALEAFDTVVSELDELRLELWVEAGEPDPEQSSTATSGINDLLDRVQDDVESLMNENKMLRRECRRLQQRQSTMRSELKRRLQRIEALQAQQSD